MTQVVDMLDATGVDAGRIPAGTKRVAIYLTGSGGIAWTNADVARLVKDDPELQTIYRIVQANNPADTFLQVKTLVIDIEPGAATLPVAIEIARTRAAHGLRTVFYYFEAEGPQVRQAVNAAGLELHIDYWLAWWTNDRAQAISLLGRDGIVAVQWRSGPYLDYSVTQAEWPAPIAKPKPRRKPIPKPPLPHPKVTVGGVSGVLTAALLAYLNSHGAHVTHLDPAESSLVSVVAGWIVAYLTPLKK